MPAMISMILTLVVTTGSSSRPPVRYNDLDPSGADPWAIIPVHYHHTGARPQWNDGEAPADQEAKSVLDGLRHSLGLWEGETDFWRASEAIVTWDHGRFALGMLTQALSRQGHNTAFNAAMAIRRIGPYAESAVPSLIAIVQRKNDFPKPRNESGPNPWDRRAYAALALGGIGPKADRAVPAIIPLLTDESPDTRWAAAKALGEIGEAAKSGPGTSLISRAKPGTGLGP
jgi:hypothetical protein